MNITIISVGKIKEKYLKLGIDEYRKRLSGYCKLNIVEVLDEKAPENLSSAQGEAIKFREGQRILRHIRKGMYVISLDIKGDILTSEELASHINSLGTSGKSHIAFIIGGSLGLCNNVSKIADYKLSFSSMTFPHQLMRLILLEQVYRAFKIIRGEPYHK